MRGKRKRGATHGQTGGDDALPRLHVEPEGTPAPPDPSEASSTISASLRRLHERLKDPLALMKLHLQHYHMSESSFRKRTAALKLPREIYDKYREVVSRCDHCSVARPAPNRSKVSG